MNFESEGLPILKVYKKDDKKYKKGKIIYVTDDLHSLKKPEISYECKPDEVLKLIPIFTRERNVLYITGMSGSGKSYFLNQYIIQYKKQFPKRKIYLFSSLTSDKTLDSNKTINRVNLDKDFMEAQFDVEDFQDSVIIFDDIDVLRQKDLKSKIIGLMNTLLCTGRHVNCDVIYTSHNACCGDLTKVILCEATHMVFFPKNSGTRSLNYLLSNYAGMNKKEIEQLRQLKTRSVCLIKTYPNVILYDKGAYILNHEYL